MLSKLIPELIIVLLSLAFLAAPMLVWVILKKISAADRLEKNSEELQALENSLSLMIKELEESVQKALADMENAADKLNKMIDKADDRIRQLQYYYEYGEELRPIVQTLKESDASPSPGQNQTARHKEVYELSRKGWSAAQIAKHTGMSTDEVQLIVNLMEISSMGSSSQPGKGSLA